MVGQKLEDVSRLFCCGLFQELEDIKHDCRSVMSFEAGIYEKVTWQLDELLHICS